MINTQYNVSKNIIIDMNFLTEKLTSYNKNNDTICVTNLYKYTEKDNNSINIISENIKYFKDININDYVCFIIHRIISSSSITLNVVLTQNLHSYRFYTIQKLITIFNTNIRIVSQQINSLDDIMNLSTTNLYVLDNLSKEKNNGTTNNFYNNVKKIIDNIDSTDDTDNYRIYPVKMLFENIFLLNKSTPNLNYYREKYSDWRSQPVGNILCPQYWGIEEILNEISNIERIIKNFVTILNIINYSNIDNQITFNCMEKYIKKIDGITYYDIYESNAVKLQSENIEAKAKPLENGTVYKPEKESDEILKSYIKIINKIKILNTKTTDIEKTNKNNKDIKYYSLLMKRYINTVYSSKNKKNKIYKEIEEKIKTKLTQRDIRYYNRLHHIEKLYTMVNFKTL